MTKEKQQQKPTILERLWLPQPFLLLVGLYLAGLILFAFGRLAFLLINFEQASSADLGEVLRAFLVGVRFDQIIILYILLPAILILPWLNIRRPWAASITKSYLIATAAGVVLLLIVDIRFYHYFGTHLNFLAYEYLGEGNLAWKLILSESYLWLVLAIWLIAVVLLARWIGWWCRRVQTVPHHRSWATQVGLFLLVVALSVLGIRGRVGLAPIDWGAAYFSAQGFVNQLALNGVYTLGRNALERGGDLRLGTMTPSERFAFVPRNTAIATTRRMLNLPGDEWLEPDNSLLRTSPPSRPEHQYQPNVILLIMESWAASTTGILGCPHDLTPNFDRLAGRSYLYSNFYASGTRTSYGLSATLASFPSLPGRSIMTRYDALHPFETIPEILGRRGYFNVYVYGGDMVFDNMQGFLREKGYDRFVGEEWLGSENEFSKWGIPDQVVFEKAELLVESLPRPFNLTVLSLSNHEPFDLPDSSVQRFFDDEDSSRVFNAQAYADFALGRFLDWFVASPLSDSTVLVITADHCRYRAGRYILDPEVFRIPLLIYAPSLLSDYGIIDPTYGSQVDILPTLMGLLGQQYRHASWGRDLFRVPPDSGFATINGSDRIGYLDHRYYYLEHLGRSKSLYDVKKLGDPAADVKDEHPDAFNKIQTRIHHYMQAAEQLSTTRIK